MVEKGFDVIKQQFWDSIRLQYSWPRSNLSIACVCRSTFTIQHSISCKKGVFINIHYNDVKHLTANLLSEVYRDVQVESTLLPLTEERMENRTAFETNEARLNITARGFCIRGQQAFLDVRIFDTKAYRYSNLPLSQCYTTKKKRKSVTITNALY